MITPERAFCQPETVGGPRTRPAAALRVVRPGRVLESFAFRACDNGLIRAVGSARIAGRVYRELRLIVPHQDAPYLYSPVHRGCRDGRNRLMRVLLVVPVATGLSDPFAYPPLGPLMIGAVCEQAGYSVDLLFAHWDGTVVRYGTTRDLSRYRPRTLMGYDVVGVNLFAEATFDAGCAVLPDIPEGTWRLCGGAFVTSAPDEAIAAGFDIGIMDEGEATIVELLSVLPSRFPVPADPWHPIPLQGVAGICYLDSEGQIIKTPHRAYIDPLDSLPPPAWHLLDPALVAQRTPTHLAADRISTTLFATRGCPFECSFCDREVFGRLFRTHSPEYLVDHLRWLREQYGVNHVRFPDDLFTTSPKWVRAFCAAIQDEDITWVTLSRTDTLTLDLCHTMREAGCVGLFFGVESGSQRLLKMMNKHNTVEQNGQAIRWCRDAGITSSVYLIFGFPGENRESLQETLAWLDTYRPDRAHYSTFMPLHGTDTWKDPEKYGIRIKRDYRRWYYYDDPAFPVEYLPPNPPNTEMAVLRAWFRDEFGTRGYLGWQETVTPAMAAGG